MSDRLFLLDSTLLFFRALYGVPDRFEDGQGRSVNGVRGYLSFLLNLLNRQEAQFCAAAFDESLTSCWRNRLFPDYKANRPEADENILYQLRLCRELSGLLGLPVLADLEYEADDFIATLARTTRRQTVIVSRDKDLQQLLTDSVILLDPADESLKTEDSFRAEFGFEPGCYPDYQALTGDSVDNVPGVKGIGPKGAGALVRAFSTLERIYEEEKNWVEAGIKPTSKVAGNLRGQREEAFLYRQILRLDDRVPLSLRAADLRINRPQPATVRDHLKRLDLDSGLGSAVDRAVETFCG